MRKRLPPYGRLLEQRLLRGDPPFLVIVALGEGCWDEAKRWMRPPRDNVGLPYPGDQPPGWYRWPVEGCLCIVSHRDGSDDRVINQLTTELLRSGAASVAVYDHEYGEVRAIYPAREMTGVAA